MSELINGEGLGPAALSTPTEIDFSPAETQQTVAPEQTETFANKFDPNSLPPELQGRYKEMLGDYTKKTMEVAPYRKLSEQLGGMAPEQIAKAVNEYNQISQMSPDQILQAVAQQMGPSAALQMIAQMTGQQQQPQQQANPFADDPYYDQMRQAILNEINPLIEPIKQEFQQSKNQQFVNTVKGEIGQVLSDPVLAGAGLTEDAVWNACVKGGFGPGQVQLGAIEAMGGVAKYNELLQRKAIENYTNQIKTNNQNTSTTITGGIPAIQQMNVTDLSKNEMSDLATRMLQSAMNTRNG